MDLLSSATIDLHRDGASDVPVIFVSCGGHVFASIAWRPVPARYFAARHSLLQALREGWANRRSALLRSARPPILPAKNLIVASALDSPDVKSTSAPSRPASRLPDRTASGPRAGAHRTRGLPGEADLRGAAHVPSKPRRSEADCTRDSASRDAEIGIARLGDITQSAERDAVSRAPRRPRPAIHVGVSARRVRPSVPPRYCFLIAF